MAQWKQVKELSGANPGMIRRISEVLRRQSIPLDVRHYCPEWIESQTWSEICREDECYEQGCQSSNLLEALIKEIEGVCASSEFIVRAKLELCVQELQRSFQSDPCQLVKALENCMATEKLLIQSITQREEGQHQDKELPDNPKINETIQELKIQLTVNESDLRLLQKKQKIFLDDLNKWTKKAEEQDAMLGEDPTRAEFTKGEMHKLEQKKRQSTADIYALRKKMCEKLVGTATKLGELLSLIWKEIQKWEYQRKKHMNMMSEAPHECFVNILDNICSEGCDFLFNLLGQFEQAFNIYDQLMFNPDPNYDELKGHYTILEKFLADHVNRIFIVEKLSRTVLKISSGRNLVLNVSVRILGGFKMGLHNSKLPKVKVELYAEKDIQDGLSGVKKKGGICEISNNEVQVEYNRASHQFIGTFSSMALAKKKKEPAGKDEQVAVQKYAMIFTTEISVRNKPVVLRVISLPMVITSQTSQECAAKGTLLWDAAFPLPDRKAFEVQKLVPWKKLGKVMDDVCECMTDRRLDADHLQFLGRKVLREKSNVDVMEKEVTFEQFCRDKLVSKRDFSFWKWFYANLNLVRLNCISKHWKSGVIYGFVGKSDAEERLISYPLGTFLLRFSETNLEGKQSQSANVPGCLTLAVVELNPVDGKPKVFHVREHLSASDIMERGLEATLLAMEVQDFEREDMQKPLLKYLYPDKIFTKVFQNCAGEKSGATNTADDYRESKFKIEIYLTDKGRMVQDINYDTQPSTPATPGSSYMDVLSPSTSDGGVSGVFNEIQIGSPGSSASSVTQTGNDQVISEADIMDIQNFTTLLEIGSELMIQDQNLYPMDISGATSLVTQNQGFEQNLRQLIDHDAEGDVVLTEQGLRDVTGFV